MAYKGKKFKKPSLTTPGEAYSIKTLVSKFQAGGVVSQQLFREGTYNGESDDIDPFQDPNNVDITDIQKATEKLESKIASAQAEAKRKKQEEEEAKKKDDQGTQKDDTTNDDE
jgi:hypothetical protein